MKTENENKTFYPELSEKGKLEALKLIDSFKGQMAQVSDKIIMDLYCDILPHIESDAWQNFKNQILNELCDYKSDSDLDYGRIRKTIYKEHKEQIDKDLDQDLLKEIKMLKSTIHNLQNNTSRY